VCDPHTGTGVPPATVAEWTLQGDGNQDFYDGPIVIHTSFKKFAGSDSLSVSLVDGYNLPLSVTNNVGCPTADCPVDLGPNCRYHCFFGCFFSLLKSLFQVPLQSRVLLSPQVFQSDARVPVKQTLMGIRSAFMVLEFQPRWLR
jgi:hypothetical protein